MSQAIAPPLPEVTELMKMTTALLEEGAGREPAWPWRSRWRVPGLRGPTSMLPIRLDNSSPGKVLRPMHLTGTAEEPSWEAGQVRPSVRGDVSHPLWPLGYLLPLALLERCPDTCQQVLTGCGTEAFPSVAGCCCLLQAPE